MKPSYAHFDETEPEDKDLNQLIFDVAEHGRRSDAEELFARMDQMVLYFSPAEASNEGIISVPTALVQGEKCLTFFANDDDPRLGPVVMRLRVAQIMDMVEQTKDVGGFIFYNNQTSNFGVPRTQFSLIRHKYLS